MNVDPPNDAFALFAVLVKAIFGYLSGRLCGARPGDCAAFVRASHTDAILVLCPSRPGLCSTLATFYTYGAVHVSTGDRIDPYLV